MPKKHLKNELIKVFKSELRIKVKEKSKIYDFENWDSLGNFNVLLACEKRFKIKFNSREFSSLNSFKEIYKIVQKKA
tara:strand:+ start:468 stop:698 length:231 start_codon:yes stop_codon:yes gene_type:complete